jgi:hypothetical protein
MSSGVAGAEVPAENVSFSPLPDCRRAPRRCLRLRHRDSLTATGLTAGMLTASVLVCALALAGLHRLGHRSHRSQRLAGHRAAPLQQQGVPPASGMGAALHQRRCARAAPPGGSPRLSCRRIDAVFSGNTTACSIQRPAASDASIKAGAGRPQAAALGALGDVKRHFGHPGIDLPRRHRRQHGPAAHALSSSITKRGAARRAASNFAQSGASHSKVASPPPRLRHKWPAPRRRRQKSSGEWLNLVVCKASSLVAALA